MLTLAVSTAHAFLAPLLHVERIVAALRAEVAGHGIERQRAGRRAVAIGIAAAVLAGAARAACALLRYRRSRWQRRRGGGLDARRQVQLDGAGDGIRQRAHAARAEAYRGAAADGAELARN